MACVRRGTLADTRKRLTTAYNISKDANNNVLRSMIFAFTTSVHLYGAGEKQLQQLETGQELAKLMGGKDAEDGVGQLALGLWFAEKLREYHRREGNAEAHAAAKASQQRHIRRLELQKGQVGSIPSNGV